MKAELAPRPGRTANTLRLTAIALIVVALCEALRIPNAATAAYMAFIIFKSDADATIPMAVVAGFAILFGIMVSIVFFAATLSEPALRIPLMAAITFGAIYLSRASRLGTAAFVSGLFTVVSLTHGDDLLSGDLSPYNSSDVEGPALPSLAYMSPEEALVHDLLWLALAIAMALAVVVAVDRLTQPDPERKLRQAIAERLAALAAFCAGQEGARGRVADFARAGSAALSAQNAVAGKLKGGRYRPAFGQAVIGATADLMLVLLASARLPVREVSTAALRAAGPVLSAAASAVRNGTSMETGAPSGDEIGGDAHARRDDEAEAALGALLARSLAELRRAIDDPEPPEEPGSVAGLMKPDALANPAYRRFAFKATLAVMACYLFMNLTDWSSISTCVTTCFVVSLDGIGQSIHKMLLRVSGALVGGSIGFVYILFVMPALTDLGQLLCVMAPVLLFGAWIRTGSERIGYFGQQLAFAFMLVLVQDYGPTLHFQVGRDRVIGILVGEVATVVVFLHIWPVSVGILVRKGVADALGRLAAALARADRPGTASGVQDFADAVAQVRGLLADQGYEPGQAGSRSPGPHIDDHVLLRLQALAVPASIVAAERHDHVADGPVIAYAADFAAWLRLLSAWVVSGARGEHLAGSLPPIPEPAADGRGEARSTWCGVLDSEAREILVALGLRASWDDRDSPHLQATPSPTRAGM